MSQQPSTLGHGTKTITEFLPATVDLADDHAGAFLAYSGMMREHDRIWTLGPNSTLAFVLPPIV